MDPDVIGVCFTLAAGEVEILRRLDREIIDRATPDRRFRGGSVRPRWDPP
jgi:hypothetical protein